MFFSQVLFGIYQPNEVYEVVDLRKIYDGTVRKDIKCVWFLLVGGGSGVESYVSMPGGNPCCWHMLTRGGEGGQKSENFADIVCERSLIINIQNILVATD